MEILEWEGTLYAKGHYKGSEFAQAVYDQYGKIINSNEVRRRYWRVGKSGTAGKFGYSQDASFQFNETDGPGHGAFAVTLWRDE